MTINNVNNDWQTYFAFDNNYHSKLWIFLQLYEILKWEITRKMHIIWKNLILYLCITRVYS